MLMSVVRFCRQYGGCNQMKSNRTCKSGYPWGLQASKPSRMSGRDAVDSEFSADVLAGARARHRIEDERRCEIEQQVLDQFAGAVARKAGGRRRDRPRSCGRGS